MIIVSVYVQGNAAGEYASQLLKACCAAQPKGCYAYFVLFLATEMWLFVAREIFDVLKLEECAID